MAEFIKVIDFVTYKSLNYYNMTEINSIYYYDMRQLFKKGYPLHRANFIIIITIYYERPSIKCYVVVFLCILLD